MRRYLDYLWPVIGLGAVVLSLWLLHEEFRGESVGPTVVAHLRAISPSRYLLAFASTLAAYAALAWYDRIALQHLHIRHISWTFVSICSFTTYALGHNIGASVFSGAMVRYRAYSAKGLSAAEVAVLVALCSLTFALGTLLLGGIVLVGEPQELRRLARFLPPVFTNVTAARALGVVCLALVAAYAIGSALRLKPLRIGGFQIAYPRRAIAAQQFIAAPLELLGAAGIIYFALPDAGHPSFAVVLAVFLASFSVALVSNAPGGLGVFELMFINAMPSVPRIEVLSALLIFRLFYLLIPLAFALVVVVLFERGRLAETLRRADAESAPPDTARPEQARP
jgi:uncharacterized membrane protein YbhN (UPF0104 family)